MWTDCFYQSLMYGAPICFKKYWVTILPLMTALLCRCNIYITWILSLTFSCPQHICLLPRLSNYILWQRHNLQCSSCMQSEWNNGRKLTTKRRNCLASFKGVSGRSIMWHCLCKMKEVDCYHDWRCPLNTYPIQNACATCVNLSTGNLCCCDPKSNGTLLP